MRHGMWMSAAAAVLKSPASPSRPSLRQKQSDPQAGSLHRPSSYFRSRLRIVHHRRSRSLSLLLKFLILMLQKQNQCPAISYADGANACPCTVRQSLRSDIASS
jgi:hypothetical protein